MLMKKNARSEIKHLVAVAAAAACYLPIVECGPQSTFVQMIKCNVAPLTTTQFPN